MNPNSSAEVLMAHPQEPKPDTVDKKPPMAHQKPGLSRRIQVGLAKLGLITTIASGGAGAVHHATGVDLGGPVPVGAAADTVGGTAVDVGTKAIGFAAKTGGDLVTAIDNSLNPSEPQQAQENLNQEKAAVEALFKPIGFQEGGEIEIDVAKLPEAATQEIMLARRTGTAYQTINVSEVTAVDNLPIKAESRIAVNSPTVYGASENPYRYFTANIETLAGLVTVLIPESSVTITEPGVFKPITAATNETPLDVARLLPSK